MSFIKCSNPNVPLYVGTYTEGDSEGIYKFQFNTETGKLNDKQLVSSTNNPSFIAYSPDKKFVYAVNENDAGSISAFKIDSNGNLELLNTVSSNGGYPCHISIDNKGRKAVVSNYGGGTVSIHTINDNGSFNEANQVFNHNTDSIISHAHSAKFIENQLIVSDLGKNSVYNYQLNSESKYELLSASIVEMNVNDGPRHFALTKDGQFIYIINELSNTITSAKNINNEYQLIETSSTLDENYKKDSFCADIHLSQDENFLYGSNRGENSIVVFKRNSITGKIKKIQSINVHGDWPRNFTIDNSGNFLLVANQRSHNISVFKIETDSGKLTFLESVELSSPVSLLF